MLTLILLLSVAVQGPDARYAAMAQSSPSSEAIAAYRRALVSDKAEPVQRFQERRIRELEGGRTPQTASRDFRKRPEVSGQSD